MSYQPFLIADFKTGIQLNKEPWLLPQDAFIEMENAYLYQGVITKRMGYTEFHPLQHSDPQDVSAYVEVDIGADRMTITTSKVAVTDMDTDEAVYCYKDFTADYFNTDDEFELDFKCTDGGSLMVLWALTQDLGAVVSLAAANKNLIYIWMNAADKLQIASYHNGAQDNDITDAALTIGTDYYLRIKLDRTAGTATCYIYSDTHRTTLVDTIVCDIQDITDDYQYLFAASGSGNGGGGVTWDGEIRNLCVITWPGSDVMGLFTFDRAAGTSEFLGIDELRVNKYNTVSERFEDISLADNFAGGDDDFFHIAVYNDALYMVNNTTSVGAFGMFVYDGATVAGVNVDIDGGPNDLKSAKFVIDYKSRLLLFSTNEDTDGACPQRVRWPAAGTVDYSGDDYVDCPTQDWITSIGFVGDVLIVYFSNSVWALKYTGDATLPYRWENIATNRGSAAPFSTIAFPDELITVSPTGLAGCDGLDVDELLPQAPDVSLSWALDNLKYCYGTYHGETRQMWVSYPAFGETYANRVLVYNHKEKTAATYVIDCHCFGEYTVDLDLTWDEVDDEWDEVEWAWDDPTRAGGYPQIMMGARDGYTYVMNEGITDDGTPVTMTIKSGRWNPYNDKALKARLGYIDFLVDKDPAVTITVKLYKDMNPTSYATKTFLCNGDGDKEWKRIKVNQTARSHTIEIIHADDQQPKIHAIMPWFKPAGRVI